MARKQNIVIDQGSTFTLDIDLNDAQGNPYDLTGHTGSCELRKHYLSANSVAVTVALGTGELTLSLTSTQTANIQPGKYVYDVKITSNSNVVTRVLEGLATVTPDV